MDFDLLAEYLLEDNPGQASGINFDFSWVLDVALCRVDDQDDIDWLHYLESSLLAQHLEPIR
jgi:hypothetical protein